MQLRFVTWNLNLFTQGRLGDKLDLLEGVGFDVAAIQEVTRPSVRALRERFPNATIVDGVSWSGWDSRNAHGATLVVLSGLEVIDQGGLSLEWWHLDGGLIDGPPLGSIARASVRVGSKVVEVMAAHPPNAAAKSSEEYLARSLGTVATYGAIERWAASHHPVVLGIDANAWVDTAWSPFEAPVYSADPQLPIMEFFGDGSSRHGLRDVFRAWLESRPEELAQIRRRRPRGPLATTHMRGGNGPIPDRFDVIMATEAIEPIPVEHHHQDASAAGSDHAVVIADLELNA
jgi:exonuclease III